jgi:hypothetical protein
MFKLFDYTGLSEYKIHKIQEKLFTLAMYISYILYIALLFGFSATAPQYIETLHYYVSVYVGLFLVWRFNMFRHVKFTELDRKIVFNAGIFILSTTVLNSLFNLYLPLFNTYF